MKTLKCWLWKGLWGLGLLSLVLAWVAVFRRGLVLGLEPLAWYWNALVFGVLSVPIKLDCHSSDGVCPPGSENA